MLFAGFTGFTGFTGFAGFAGFRFTLGKNRMSNSLLQKIQARHAKPALSLPFKLDNRYY
jgi:hypothetical protein